MILDMLAKRRRNKVVEAIWTGRVTAAGEICATDVSMGAENRSPVQWEDGRLLLGRHENRIDRLLHQEAMDIVYATNSHLDGPEELRLNAFEAAVATRREDLALAIWNMARDGQMRYQTTREGAYSTLMFAAAIASQELLGKLARICPQKEWTYVARRDGKTAWSILENRGDPGCLRAVEAGWMDTAVRASNIEKDPIRF